MKALDTPVLLLIFNRPDLTAKVFESIRKMRPRQLFIAADGPRSNVKGELNKCLLARKVVGRVDWQCKVKTLFQSENLGCGLGPVTGINWSFDNVESGIILEDDCLPNESFFYFCQELLHYYRNNPKIMHISGDNFQMGRRRGNASYFFSEYTHNWGWATWRRAWKYYDYELLNSKKRKHIWDKQWLMTIQKQRGLAILPNVNLVSNIGFGNSATHTKQKTGSLSLPTKSINFPLVHPQTVRRDILADYFTFRHYFGGKTINFALQELLRLV